MKWTVDHGRSGESGSFCQSLQLRFLDGKQHGFGCNLAAGRGLNVRCGGLTSSINIFARLFPSFWFDFPTVSHAKYPGVLHRSGTVREGSDLRRLMDHCCLRNFWADWGEWRCGKRLRWLSEAACLWEVTSDYNKHTIYWFLYELSTHILFLLQCIYIYILLPSVSFRLHTSIPSSSFRCYLQGKDASTWGRFRTLRSQTFLCWIQWLILLDSSWCN